MKHIKTKFFRALWHILKRTQKYRRSSWRYVPLQDFFSSFGIDWLRTVAGIDRQLYAKYGLDNNEIGFIEPHVKEMKRPWHPSNMLRPSKTFRPAAPSFTRIPEKGTRINCLTQHRAKQPPVQSRPRPDQKRPGTGTGRCGNQRGRKRYQQALRAKANRGRTPVREFREGRFRGSRAGGREISERTKRSIRRTISRTKHAAVCAGSRAPSLRSSWPTATGTPRLPTSTS